VKKETRGQATFLASLLGTTAVTGTNREKSSLSPFARLFLSTPAPSSASDSSPARHRAAVSNSSAEVLYNPHKPLHFSLLDADKLNPNRPFIVPAHNIQNRCGFNLKQRLTVRFMDPEVKKLARGDRGVSFYRTALSRQVDHGAHTRHLLAGIGQLESNRKPHIFSKVIVVDEAAPPPLKGEKSVSAELATKGIEAEEAPASIRPCRRD